MDRKLVWTEKASSDIEAIVRYIARRDPKAAARIGLGIYDRAQILLEHPEAGTILDELREAGWRKLIFRFVGKSFTRFAQTRSSSADYGQPRWAKPIWKRLFR
jgi:plasmid stabilization system protein ParE